MSVVRALLFTQHLRRQVPQGGSVTDTCLKALLSILDWNNNPKIQYVSHPHRCKKKAPTGDGDRTA
jgi:hypothetical protein